MAYELLGILHKKYDIESKSGSFQTREFVVTTEETYPQFVKFQLTQDRCNILDNYNEGEKVKVHFDLKGREWQGKFFTNLNAWKMEKGGGNVEQAKPSSFAQEPGKKVDFDPFEGQSLSEDFGDLPF
jgi:single-strand DNA-binding protein